MIKKPSPHGIISPSGKCNVLGVVQSSHGSGAGNGDNPFQKFVDEKFKAEIIYADPAWKFVTYSKKGMGKSPDNHYKTMTLNEIKGLPINTIAAENCVCFLWVVDNLLDEGIKVLESWGFTFKTVAFTWAKHGKKVKIPIGKKPTKIQRIRTIEFNRKWHFGMGYWTRANPEMCLLGTKGHPKRDKRNVRQLVISSVREHSRKPDRIKNDIVNLCGDISRIELFSRTKTPGWSAWGDELGKYT